MNNRVDDLLGECQRALVAARADKSAWARLAVPTEIGDLGRAGDLEELAHVVARAQVLWAMQYDRDVADAELLRFLVAQEGRWHRISQANPSPELALGVYLMAASPRPGDTLRLWDVLTANFDVFNKLDARYLAAEGFATATSVAARQTDAAHGGITGVLFDQEGAPRFDDADVARLLREDAQRFPDDPAQEDPAVWVSRAQVVGDRVLLGAALRSWEESDCPPSALHQAHLYGVLHDYRRAARAQRHALSDVAFADLPQAVARLVELERLAEEFAEAAEDLERGLRIAELVDETLGRGTYLGPRLGLVEQGLLLVAADPDVDRARASFAMVEPGDLSISLSTLALVAARAAAERLGDHDRADVWRARLQEKDLYDRKLQSFNAED